jgi:uncharacterized protein (TIGR04222 family)
VSNPLDFPGPQFLVFYACTAAIVLGLLHVVRSSAEGGAAPRLDTTDPYLIAYLRGGTFEALRVATVVLVDRRLLDVDEDEMTVKRRKHMQTPRVPLEQALIGFFVRERPAQEIFYDLDLIRACADYERRLASLGLLPDDERRAARRRWIAAALTVLIGLGAAKLIVALGRGRTNIIFLVVFTIVASIAAVKMTTPFRTTRGNAVLADLRRLFARLPQRAAGIREGKGDADAALLAAVFGLAALPTPAFGYVRKLYPRKASSGGDSGGCGSSCGSGCGGGGDGGGCGGCGGGGGD